MTAAALQLRHHAYSSFTEKLLARDILPGQVVSQRELVALTGMPLGAIREMIPRLEADGLLRTVPKRGMQVMAIDVNLIRDAFQLRRMIEAEAVANFCREAPEADISRVARDHRDIAAHDLSRVDTALLDRAQELDWTFHDLIVDRMNNRILSEVYRVNSIKIRLIASSATRMHRGLVGSVMNEHMAIVEALEARNESRAVAAMVAHIESARRRALDG